MSLTKLLGDNLAAFGTYVSIIYDGREYTNQQHDTIAQEWASALTHLGVGPLQRVLIVLPNRPEVFFAYTATLKAGAVVVPVLPLLQAHELSFIIQDSKPTVIITSDLLADKIDVALASVNETIPVLSVDTSSPRSIAQYVDGDSVSRLRVRDVNDDEIAAILYTSGTSGRPKGVQLSHQNLVTNAQGAATRAEAYPLKTGRRMGLFVLPMSHAFGFTMMNTAILLGEPNILLPFFNEELVFQAIETYRVTHFSAVPTMYARLLSHPAADQYDLSSLSVCISGSAPMPMHQIEAFEHRFGTKIYQGYGLSEASPIVTAPRFDKPYKPGSVGLPLPDVTVRIVDAQGCEKPTGEVGELVVKGPNVTCGYHGLPGETEQAIQDGWLHTGDVGKMDEEGFVYVVGRLKDVIIRGGFNVYPQDVEQVLRQHPAVLDAAVVGRASPTVGEEVVAFVVRKPQDATSAEDLIAFTQERLAKYKTPRYVHLVTYLPTNLIGKVDKKALRSRDRQLGELS